MNFKTTLTAVNEKEFVKSWTSIYQSGLMQFRGEKRAATDIGFIRPVTSYLIGFIAGFAIINWGMQAVTSTFSGIEICFGTILLFILSINIAYSLRSRWFRHIANSKILPKGTVEITADETGLSFFETGSNDITRFYWKEITKVIRFTNTLIIYAGECNGYPALKDHVLLINRADLSPDELNALDEKYLQPLNIQNKFKGYYSYSDLVIFLVMCIIIALASLPFSGL